MPKTTSRHCDDVVLARVDSDFPPHGQRCGTCGPAAAGHLVPPSLPDAPSPTTTSTATATASLDVQINPAATDSGVAVHLAVDGVRTAE